MKAAVLSLAVLLGVLVFARKSQCQTAESASVTDAEKPTPDVLPIILRPPKVIKYEEPVLIAASYIMCGHNKRRDRNGMCRGIIAGKDSEMPQHKMENNYGPVRDGESGTGFGAITVPDIKCGENEKRGWDGLCHPVFNTGSARGPSE